MGIGPVSFVKWVANGGEPRLDLELVDKMSHYLGDSQGAVENANPHVFSHGWRPIGVQIASLWLMQISSSSRAHLTIFCRRHSGTPEHRPMAGSA